MARNQDTPIIQDGDAEVTGQLQAGTVAVQDRILAQINNKLAVDGYAVLTEEQKNALGGYAALDNNGKIATSALPQIAISKVAVVSSQAAQLALTAEEGDLAVRSDQSRTYVHNGGTSATMSDWTEIARTAGTVSSVAGRTGDVTLTISDIADLATTLSNLSTGKANTSHTHTLANITDAGTAASRNVPTTGDATSTQVVLGSDSRLANTGPHTHPISDVTNLQSSLDGKSNVGHTHTTSDITNAGSAATKDAPASGDATSGQVVLGSDTRLTDSRNPNPHSHQISDVTNLQTTLDGKASTSHTHTLSSVTDAGTAASKNVPATGDAGSTEVVLGSDTRLTNSRTPTSHTHSESDVTGLTTSLAGKVDTSDSRLTDARTPTAHKASHATGGTDALTPSDIGAAPSAHTHSISDVGFLQTALDSKAAVSHTHTLANIVDAGTAASKNVATTGDAASNQVVQGSDTRLTNARTPTAHKASHILQGGISETQLLTVAGDDGSGTFTLTFKGQTTAAISVPTSVTSIRTALEALSTIGPGNVLVEAFLPGVATIRAYQITFINALGMSPQDMITSNGSNLSGGGTIYRQTTAPGTGTLTSLWIDTDDNNIHVWDGTNWVLFANSPPFESTTASTLKVINATITEGVLGSTIGSDYISPGDIGAASFVHVHSQAEVLGLTTALSGKLDSSDSRLPSSDQKAALVGTSGTPSASNKFVTDSDSRLGAGSVSAHKSTHATGGTDALSASDIGAMSSTALTRQSTTTSVTVAAGAEASVSITLASAFALWQLETDKAARVRLYTTSAARTADTSRASSTTPAPGNGLITEVITTAGLLKIPMSPPALGANLDTTPSSTIYALVRNDGATSNVSLTLTWVKQEV